MAIEDERQSIMSLWYSIEPKIKGDLAYLWEERRELGELEALVEKLEPKVIKLLEVIPTLKRHSHEYHARTVDLIKLLHHFNEYKSSEEWIQKVTSDLDFVSAEIKRAISEAIRNIRPEQAYEDFVVLATQSYLQMLAGKAPQLTPMYLKINPQTYGGSELAKKVIYLDETQYMWDPFIGFYKQGQPYGLLFPNPVLEYTESMSLVFQNLRQENALSLKSKISPVKIIQKSPRLWQVLDT